MFDVPARRNVWRWEVRCNTGNGGGCRYIACGYTDGKGRGDWYV